MPATSEFSGSRKQLREYLPAGHSEGETLQVERSGTAVAKDQSAKILAEKVWE
jgi:hypothetical protein